jgi:hypothetical protein
MVMAEDARILEQIGRWLQAYKLKGKKKGKKKIGLESNMRKVQTKDPFLTSMLTAAKFEGRTDEGALMELREQFPKL